MITQLSSHVLACISRARVVQLCNSVVASHLSFLDDFLYHFMYYSEINTPTTTCVFSNQSALHLSLDDCVLESKHTHNTITSYQII